MLAPAGPTSTARQSLPSCPPAISLIVRRALRIWKAQRNSFHYQLMSHRERGASSLPASGLDYYNLGSMLPGPSFTPNNRHILTGDRRVSIRTCSRSRFGAVEDPAIGPSNTSNEKLRSSVIAGGRGNASTAEKVPRLAGELHSRSS
jgi:hypothetical protein